MCTGKSPNNTIKTIKYNNISNPFFKDYIITIWDIASYSLEIMSNSASVSIQTLAPQLKGFSGL